MNNFRTVLSIALLLFGASSIAAQEGTRADRLLSAAQLQSYCAASEATEAGRLSMGYCLGAITGIADASMTLNAALAGRQTICLKESDNAEKMRLSFLMFVEQRPDVLELPAATVVIATLQSNFPCGSAE